LFYQTVEILLLAQQLKSACDINNVLAFPVLVYDRVSLASFEASEIISSFFIHHLFTLFVF